MPIDKDKIASLVKRINETGNADFVKRLLDERRKVLNNDDGTVSTHELGYVTKGDRAVVFPGVQSDGDTLRRYPYPESYERAVERGDTVQMSIPEAELFTKNYKDYYPGFNRYPGGGRFFRAGTPSGSVPGTLLTVPTFSTSSPSVSFSPVEHLDLGPVVDRTPVELPNPAAPIVIPGRELAEPFDMSKVQTSVPSLDPVADAARRIMEVENSKTNLRGGWNALTQRWYPHRSHEGGADTIAYGIKLSNGSPEAALALKQGYLTDEQAVSAVDSLVRKHYDAAKKVYDKKYGAGEWDKLSDKSQSILVDYSYNPGLSKFPKLMEGFHSGNMDMIRENYKRYSGGKELGRNKTLLKEIDTLGSEYPIFRADGGKIHIAESKKGTFTAAANKHGKSVQAFASQVLANKENYSPAMVKKANFARNAAKWHADGGLIDRFGVDAVREALVAFREKHKYDGESEDSQQMSRVVDLSGGRYPITLNYSPVLDDGTMLLSPSSVIAQRSYSLPDLKNLQQVNERYAYLVEPQVASRDNTSVSGIPVLSQTVLPIGDENDFKISAALGKNMNNEIDKKVASLKSGEDLKIFQQKLVDLGYDLGTYGEKHDGVDGKIGRKTRAAARKYYQALADEAKLNEQILQEQVIPPVRSADMVQLERLSDIRDTIATADMPLAMTDAITDRERRRNRLTLWPEHAINQVVGKSMGDRGIEAAAEVERTNAAAKQANESGDLFEIAAAKANR